MKQGTLKGQSDHIAQGYREAEAIGKGRWIWQFPEWSSVILEREGFLLGEYNRSCLHKG